MELYIVRHGQSTNNVSMLENRYDRDVDPPLTELGQRQARAVADYLACGVNPDNLIDPAAEKRRLFTGFGVTRIYCSPMLRALQTAQPLAAATGLTPDVWLDAHECGGMYMESADGRIEGSTGQTRAQIQTNFPGYNLPETITEQGWWDPAHGQEEIHEWMARAIKVAFKLRALADTDDRIALVTHGTFTDSLLKALFGQLPSNRQYYHHYNTAITRIDFVDRHRLMVRYLNRVAHLPPEMVSG